MKLWFVNGLQARFLVTFKPLLQMREVDAFNNSFVKLLKDLKNPQS